MSPAKKASAAASGVKAAKPATTTKANGKASAAAKSTVSAKATVGPKAAATRARASKAPDGKAASTKGAPAAKSTKGTAKGAPAKSAPATKRAAAKPTTAAKSSGAKAAAAKSAPAKSTPTRSAARPKGAASGGGAPTRPRSAKGPYAGDAKFLEEVRASLLAERDVYRQQANDLKAEAESLAQEREPGDVQFDEESGEGGTVTVDRERDLALSAQALAAVEEIDAALGRIQAGTYGSCERCEQPIPKPRLKALPYARLCVACKSGGLSRR